MNNGFINIHRKILDNPISKKPHWAWLWVYLLLRANWEETTIIWNGQNTLIEKGSFVTGRNSLSKDTGIPASTIEDILKYLENQQQIRQQKNNKYRVITILNWERYQKSDNKSNIKATSSRHLADTDNNINNINKNNKREATPSEEAKSFFLGDHPYQELFDSFSKDKDPSVIKREFDKFILYWTEKNKSGTRQRWEQESTFEVKRRLYTWLSRVDGFSNSNKKITKIL